MQDFPLTVTAILRHGRRVHGESECVTWTDTGSRRATFAEVSDNADRFAAALSGLGVRDGDRVGTFCWNTQEHLEAYFAIPCSGAVLHTLNVRLFPEQVAYVVNHAEDKVVVVDDSLVPLLARVADRLETVETFVVVGDGDASPLGDRDVVRYSELLAAHDPGFAYPELDERQAAAMCYTSGTTGNPKGVAYSHRSTFLHSLAATTPSALALSDRERVLTIVPMFHANAWGIPYAAFLCGASLVMPDRFLQAEPLTQMIASERVTFSGAVPTIWADIVRYGEEHEIDLSSLRRVVCGGSAVPRSLMEKLQERYGVEMVQGWGMTETSPLAAVSHAPAFVERATTEEMDWRAMTGRVVGGVELRIVDDAGRELPWDGEAVGEIEVRGPWITAAYYRDDAPEKFDDGWLRTGDVGTVNRYGFVQITDRAKDVIKSGGEWISSVELENHLMAHPDVVEASVIGVPDPRWQERPLACVVRRQGSDVDAGALAAFLAERVARWQVPERWSFIDEVPKTSVGKFDKKVLRLAHEKGDLQVETLDR
ncbi:MAG: putative medium chain fatty-acid-CoA ligase FadD [Acidimicrobiia bacterium]|nr:MAG: putative medium chain fatty-acid-CoA ligase FadD [Acidimicrobiia bacterium]